MRKFKVRTRASQEGKIIQDLYVSDGTGEWLITRYIIETQEEQVRQALIELGWTPPKETNQ